MALTTVLLAQTVNVPPTGVQSGENAPVDSSSDKKKPWELDQYTKAASSQPLARPQRDWARMWRDSAQQSLIKAGQWADEGALAPMQAAIDLAQMKARAGNSQVDPTEVSRIQKEGEFNSIYREIEWLYQSAESMVSQGKIDALDGIIGRLKEKYVLVPGSPDSKRLKSIYLTAARAAIFAARVQAEDGKPDLVEINLDHARDWSEKAGYRFLENSFAIRSIRHTSYERGRDYAYDDAQQLAREGIFEGVDKALELAESCNDKLKTDSVQGDVILSKAQLDTQRRVFLKEAFAVYSQQCVEKFKVLAKAGKAEEMEQMWYEALRTGSPDQQIYIEWSPPAYAGRASELFEQLKKGIDDADVYAIERSIEKIRKYADLADKVSRGAITASIDQGALEGMARDAHEKEKIKWLANATDAAHRGDEFAMEAALYTAEEHGKKGKALILEDEIVRINRILFYAVLRKVINDFHAGAIAASLISDVRQVKRVAAQAKISRIKELEPVMKKLYAEMKASGDHYAALVESGEVLSALDLSDFDDVIDFLNDGDFHVRQHIPSQWIKQKRKIYLTAMFDRAILGYQTFFGDEWKLDKNINEELQKRHAHLLTFYEKEKNPERKEGLALLINKIAEHENKLGVPLRMVQQTLPTNDFLNDPLVDYPILQDIPDFAGVLPRIQKQVAYCYERELVRSSYEGKIVFLLRIRPDGQVDKAVLQSADPSAINREIEGCIVRNFERLRFPPITAKESLMVRIPIQFQDKSLREKEEGGSNPMLPDPEEMMDFPK